MSRRDPGAATGGTPREPGRCGVCGRLETLHTLRAGKRGGFPTVGCKGYVPATNVVAFPGPAVALAARPVRPLADLDAIGDRYTDLLDARHRGDEEKARLLEAACADDVPVLREELHRVELLRRELAAELDRVTGHG